MKRLTTSTKLNSSTNVTEEVDRTFGNIQLQNPIEEQRKKKISSILRQS